MVYRELSSQDELDDTGQVKTRVCKICGQRKTFDLYHLVGDRKNRRRTCKSCESAKRRERNKNKPYNKSNHLRSKYGLSVEAFEKLAADQNYKCLICNKDLDFSTNVNVPDKAQVDHCHETGMVRGILCFSCNTGIGKFNDSIELLNKAIDYLNNPPEIEMRDKFLSDKEKHESYRNNGKKRVNYDPNQIPKVDRNPSKWFTEEEREQIRQEYSMGDVSQTYLAHRWSTTQSTISTITKEK